MGHRGYASRNTSSIFAFCAITAYGEETPAGACDWAFTRLQAQRDLFVNCGSDQQSTWRLVLCSCCEHPQRLQSPEKAPLRLYPGHATICARARGGKGWFTGALPELHAMHGSF